MIIIFTSKITVPVIIRNMALVIVQIFEAVIPVLRALTRPVVGLSALTRPVVGLSGKAGIQGGGEISGVGSLDPPRFAVVVPRRRADRNWRRQNGGRGWPHLGNTIDAELW
jgi:hypothetical protein